MANRLQHETSPYLRQHAGNPVDWYPWGEEALARARQEDKPILLSIGYAACHWCHVMAHESFEDPETARVLNEHFVNIKVDREERPDLDHIYMDAVQAMTGQGGWPLTVFLTPEGKPFFGGTYFPPQDRYGLPGFRRLALEVAAEYHNRRRETENVADWMLSQIRHVPVRTGGRLPGPEALEAAYQGLQKSFDEQYGGFGNNPKFPQPVLGELLLRLARRGIGPHSLAMVELTLTRMATGGIYDQLGGGFHRYSVDREWVVPHFEKMLYDNALLARLYLHAYQVTGRPLYRRIVEETLEHARRELLAPGGGFYASQDADSPGGEGAYYVWTPAAVAEALGVDEGAFACRYFGVTPQGNFEGASVLTRRADDAALAAELQMSETQLLERVEVDRLRLFERREARPKPAVDTKILAGWNGLLLAAFAEAGSALDRPDYVETAMACANYLRHALAADGRLWHTADDRPRRIPGFLQDYAFMAEGLLALYRATLQGEWLRWARELAETMRAAFWSESEGAFYDTGAGHEALILRPRDVYDDALPSGSSAATLVFLQLAAVAGHDDYRRIAETGLAGVVRGAARNPLSFGHWLCALDFATAGPREVAIVGSPADPATLALLAAVGTLYRPNLVVVGQEGAEGSPLLQDRPMLDGRPTAYYCENFTCRRPTTDPLELQNELVK